MALDPPAPRGFRREAALVIALLAGALVVFVLVLLAGSAARGAQKAEQAHADAIAADRALVELRLALAESPADATRSGRALDDARRHLAGDAASLAALERLAPLAANSPVQDPAMLAVWSEMRGRLAAVSSDAESRARREGERARGITFAAGLLLVALTIGTMMMIAAETRRRRRLAQTLERQANHDPLTMLPNRRFFLEWLGYALAQARRDGNQVALLYIDLDGFKAVNDRHGHRRGDAVLAAIAERLRATKREGDLLARLGGDEFALAAPNSRDGRELAVLGERLLATLIDPAQPRLADVAIGASIGVAFSPDDANDVPGLIAAADAAMYAAKRGGGQRVSFYATP